VAIEEQLGLKPTGRPAKSTTSISEKLNRESIRLTQIQDIAGCRIIVSDVSDQESVVAELIRIFPDVTVIDRRTLPSNGYRALHIVVGSQGKLIEIQVRTSLQHLWAELSEKYSDVVDPGIKYGKGDETFLVILTGISNNIAGIESIEQDLKATLENLPSTSSEEVRAKLILVKEEARKMLEAGITSLGQVNGVKNVVSD
jgi:ppGpp synthetase/RelA/SpoT-type nucleotidyltranferase